MKILLLLLLTTNNNNNNNNNNNSNSNSNSNSNNNNSSKSSHCEPSVISIDDYIDHSANSIFSTCNKKKKNNKYHNKSKNSNFVNNNTISNQTLNQNTNEKFSYLSLLSNIKSSSIFNFYPSFVNVKIQENDINENDSTISTPPPTTSNNSNNANSTNRSPIYGNKNNDKIDKGDMVNLNDDKFGQNYIDNNTIIQNLENKSIDYIISSKNSTTTVTSINPSLFFINCPDSVKTKSSHIKKLNFFAQDDDLKEKQEQFNESTLAHIEKSSITPTIVTKKSNLTKYISQSNLIKHDSKRDEVKEEINISLNHDKNKIKEINSSLEESGSLTSSSLLSSISYHSSSLLNSSLSYSSSPSTSYSSSLSLSDLKPIPNQLSIASTSQVVVPSPSFSTNSNFSLSDYKDTHSSFNLFNQDLDFHISHPYPDLNLKCEKMPETSESEFKLSDSTSNEPFKERNLDHLSTSSEKIFDQSNQASEDKVSYSYSDDDDNDNNDKNDLKSSIHSSTIVNTKIKAAKSSKEEICVCGCNTNNHYCSYVDHKYKLIREKRRLIKSAINIGFTDIYLKEDLDHEGEDDENSSNCDSSSSPFSSTHSKNKKGEEENEKEDIINTILLSHTDFSTFPSHLKFTINTHDVWLRWSNLEFNRNKFKDGRLL
ncbi:hypothetical protein H8356DRAFT_1752209 [Neocallimastix lanati (nom. inval.)]|nr:hypothetical protein H8356DRAFT_1752209 [Neocallimastix sp. JGI-2020a]